MNPSTNVLFEPERLTFTSVSPKLITVRTIILAITSAVAALVAGGFIVGGVLTDNGILTAIGIVSAVVVALLTIWDLWLIPRQDRAMGYAEAEDDLVFRKGIMFRSLTVVPYGRMQFVDVKQGPLDRFYSLASVVMHTASPNATLTIDGLASQEAARLREHLTELGEARLAGL